MKSNLMLQLQEMRYSYKDGFSINATALNINAGEISCLLGKNGSGKSTFIKNLVGVIEAHRLVVSPELTKQANSKIFSVMLEGEDVLNPNLTIQYNAEYVSVLNSGSINKDDIANFAKELGITDLMDKVVKKLSTGQKRLASILSLISSNPSILIMDEPTLGLDLQSIEKVKALLISLKKSGMTILFTSHDAEFVKDISDSIFHIANGYVSNKMACSENIDHVLEGIRYG